MFLFRMPIELDLISVLSNENRKKILKKCIESDISITLLQNLLGMNYCNLWRHLKILRRENLIKFYKMLPEDHRGRPFKMVTPAVTKQKITQLDKAIIKFKEESKELRGLLKEANKKYEKLYKNPKTRKIFKGIK